MKRITVYLDENTYERVTELAKQESRPVTFIAEKLIQQAIKERDRKKKTKNDGLQSGKD
jgi:predicted transcriptional regulator